MEEGLRRFIPSLDPTHVGAHGTGSAFLSCDHCTSVLVLGCQQHSQIVVLANVTCCYGVVIIEFCMDILELLEPAYSPAYKRSTSQLTVLHK